MRMVIGSETRFDMAERPETLHVSQSDYTRFAMAGHEAYVTVGENHRKYLNATAQMMRPRHWDAYIKEVNKVTLRLGRDRVMRATDPETHEHYAIYATPFWSLVCECKWAHYPALSDSLRVQLGACRHVTALQLRDRWYVPIKRVFTEFDVRVGGSSQTLVVPTEGFPLRQRLSATASLQKLCNWDAFLENVDHWTLLPKRQHILLTCGSLQMPVWGTKDGGLQCRCQNHAVWKDTPMDESYSQFGMCEHVAAVSFSGEWVPVP